MVIVETGCEISHSLFAEQLVLQKTLKENIMTALIQKMMGMKDALKSKLVICSESLEEECKDTPPTKG